MKLERLENIPDDVNARLFRALKSWKGEDAVGRIDDKQVMVDILCEVLVDRPEPVMRTTADGLEVSPFGILNGLFMHFCPGYRLMVMEGPNEPRTLWVCKEEE